jgi:hypothetical protein
MGMRLVATGVLLCAMAMQAHAATIVVTNTNDSGPGSLRQALAIANDGDTITFAVTGTIGLTSGGLLIATNVTISGPGSDKLSIDGNQALLVLGIFPGKSAAIAGLSIRNGQLGIWNEQSTLTVSNCNISGNYSYGGLYNHYGALTVSDCLVSLNSYDGLDNDEGTLNVNNCVLSGNSYYGLYSYFGETTVSNCVVSGNLSGGLVNYVQHGPNKPVAGYGYSMTIADSMINDNSGPGVWNVGFLTVLNTTISGNSAGKALDGGGILSGTSFKAPANVTLINSTISGNSASGAGGGIANYYWGVAIVNSTISGNSAGDAGGGISSSGVQISNSTLSGNSAGSAGGGISSSGGVQISNSTLSGNSALSGGGIYNVAGQYGATLEIGNTIFNRGASGENIVNNGGMVTSHGYNVCSDNGSGYLNGPGDQVNTDPLLGPLQDNGGPTLTHAPLSGSPAIDAGDPNFTPPPFHDQRGPCFYRVFGRRIDVGSVETQPQPRCVIPAPRPTPR